MEAGLLGKLGFDLEVAIANLVNFLIIFILFKIFFFSKIQKTIDERRHTIEQGLARAVAAEQSSKDAEIEAQRVITEAKRNAETILDEAHVYAGKVHDQAVLEANAERLRLVEQGARQIEQDKKRMEQEVEEQMSSLVASLSEKVIASQK
jgi:F-type H+-transporting ATPase subunit b